MFCEKTLSRPSVGCGAPTKDPPLKYQQGNWKYKLLADTVYESGIRIPRPVSTEYILMSIDGRIYVRKGYSWDGATFAVDTLSFMRGSLFHDAAYQLMREKEVPLVLLSQFDDMLVNICKDDGMNRFRRWRVRLGVRIGGGPAARPRSIKILEAP